MFLAGFVDRIKRKRQDAGVSSRVLRLKTRLGGLKSGSMEEGVRVFSNSEGTFPGMSNVIHKPIPAAFAGNQGDLFVDVFLQLIRIYILSLVKEVLQLLINPFRRF